MKRLMARRMPMKCRRPALPLVLPLLFALAAPLGASAAPQPGLDPAFGAGGEVITDFGTIDGYSPLALAYALVVQADGKLVAAGQAGGGQTYFALARYNTDGSLDPAFGSGGTTITDF